MKFIINTELKLQNIYGNCNSDSGKCANNFNFQI